MKKLLAFALLACVFLAYSPAADAKTVFARAHHKHHKHHQHSSRHHLRHHGNHPGKI